ncbi:MAG: GNAT family N-acetyltransferase [Ignavibacterium sp.]|nr:GNAT family N-acetyltransferase [Ignavibacterium sp.]
MISELDEINIKNSSSGSNKRAKILTLKNRVEWGAYLNRLPLLMQDSYYTPEYYEIYEKNGDGSARCFVYEDHNDIALYPFLLSSVNNLGYNLDKDYYDICGAYGYNGVLYSSDSPVFKQSFYKHFLIFCEAHNIIAEFTRFNPLSGNHVFSDNALDISFNRKTVYVDLTQGIETIQNNYSHSTKGNIKKAEKNNLKVAIYKNELPYKKEFIKMYKETMDRVNAQRYVYFSDSYFEATFRSLPVVQFIVFKESTPIASAICLLSKNILHVHFEVSKTEYQIYRPNDFLFDEIIKFGINEGYKILHMGGGRTLNEDDSLLRFKKNFSDTTTNFYTGNKIHNQEVYIQVCEQWRIKYPHLVQKYDDKLLKYRFLD